MLPGGETILKMQPYDNYNKLCFSVVDFLLCFAVDFFLVVPWGTVACAVVNVWF